MVVFLRVSMLHQILTHEMRVNLYYLYLFSVPAILGVLLTGGVRRTLQGRTAWYWVGFTAWLLLTVPFSTWRGGSFPLVFDYLRTNLPLLFMVAGLTLTWKEFRFLLYTLAVSGVINLVTARLFTSQNDIYGYRLALQVGTVADPNDFAAHLLFVAPFLLWIVFASKSPILRAAFLACAGALTFVVLKTASRGAAIALVVAILYFLWRASSRQKIALLVMLPVGIAIGAAVVSRDTLQRLTSFVGTSNSVDEAVASQEARRYLFFKSLEYTAKFPVFGIGPGQFSTYEVFHNEVAGMSHGLGFSTHDSFTQASAECGIPAFLMFAAGMLSAYLLAKRTYKDTRGDPRFRDIHAAAFCLLLSMVGFTVAISFLNFAYFFYEPFHAALAIVLARTAKEEMRTRAVPPPAPSFPWPLPSWKRRRSTSPAGSVPAAAERP